MIAGTPHSPPQAFIAFARDFFESLAADDYGAALGRLDVSSRRWSKRLLQEALSRIPGNGQPSSAAGITRSASPSVEETAPGEYLLKHRIPVDGKWGNAHAVFRFKQKHGTGYFHVELVAIEPIRP